MKSFDPLLTALWLLWACLLFGGFIFGSLDEEAGQRIPTWARMYSSFTLAAAGWSWYARKEPQWVRRMSLLLAVGMTCGLMGDLSLAGFYGPPRVTEGIFFFFLGHICYTLAAVTISRNATVTPRMRARLLTTAAWVLIGVLGWLLIAFPSSAPASLRWNGLLYALVLAIMAGSATALVFVSRKFIPVAAGGVLFFTSDMILSAQLFRDAHFPLIGSVVWLTYGPAQMLIIYGSNIAARSVQHRLPNGETAPQEAGGTT
jgi:hypothetical protein